MSVKTNWYVITGGPSSGIDTVLNELKKMGYRVTSEVARDIIDKERVKGKISGEVRKNEAKFQQEVLKKKIELEEKLPKNKLIFLNRAIPDSIAYYQNCGLNPQRILNKCKRVFYKKVFLLKQLPKFTKDYARTENARTAKKLNSLLKKAYKRLGYKVVIVPVTTPEKRIKFILSRLRPECKK
jgi:predicted ATPase